MYKISTTGSFQIYEAQTMISDTFAEVLSFSFASTFQKEILPLSFNLQTQEAEMRLYIYINF